MYNKITSIDLKKLIPKVKIIDIRDKHQFNLGNIPTATNIPMNSLLDNSDCYLNKEDIYYICCQRGIRSEKTCRVLSSKGYKVVNIIGGYNSYKSN